MTVWIGNLTTNINKKLFIEFDKHNSYTILIRGDLELDTIKDISDNLKACGVPYAAFVNYSETHDINDFQSSYVDSFSSIVRAEEYINDHGGNEFYDIEFYNKT